MTKFIMEYVLYFIIGLPVILTMLLYYVRLKGSGRRWKAIHTATQWTAPFYIIAVSFLLHNLFQRYFLGYILILLLIMLAIILIVQWKRSMEVILLKGLRILWRINFIIFAIIYIILIVLLMVPFI